MGGDDVLSGGMATIQSKVEMEMTLLPVKEVMTPSVAEQVMIKLTATREMTSSVMEMAVTQSTQAQAMISSLLMVITTAMPLTMSRLDQATILSMSRK